MPSTLLDDFSTEENVPQMEDGKVEVEWPVISIDEVEGLPNFETVTINGVVHQIKRNTEVVVGPAVVAILKNCIGTRYVKVEDAYGKVRNTPQEYVTIPWHNLGKQKIRVFPKEAEAGHHIYFGKAA